MGGLAKLKCHLKWGGCLIDWIPTRMDLLIRQKSMPCAKTSLKAAVVPVAAVCKAEAKRVPVDSTVGSAPVAKRDLVDSAVGSAPEVKVAGRLPEAEKGGRVVLVEDFPNPDNLAISGKRG
jgi:hypothetical protein